MTRLWPEKQHEQTTKSASTVQVLLLIDGLLELKVDGIKILRVHSELVLYQSAAQTMYRQCEMTDCMAHASIAKCLPCDVGAFIACGLTVFIIRVTLVKILLALQAT